MEKNLDIHTVELYLFPQRDDPRGDYGSATYH